MSLRRSRATTVRDLGVATFRPPPPTNAPAPHPAPSPAQIAESRTATQVLPVISKGE